MYYIITSVVILVMLIFWIISVQRSLVVMDENINNAMSQIGVQLSSRWDALTSLLDLTKGYADHEYKTISETIQARRSITKDSSPDDVTKQENMIAEALGKIMAVAESYPDLKADSTYLKTMDGVNQYENMVRTSRLIYNDSVTKINRAIRMFPVSMIAGILGFSNRAYLEA
ncbi:MAG: LemA family protein [Anaerotignum sp.]|nr:LemA family protein [Anaerotignum sp.]